MKTPFTSPNLRGIPNHIIADYAEFAAMNGISFNLVWGTYFNHSFIRFFIRHESEGGHAE